MQVHFETKSFIQSPPWPFSFEIPTCVHTCSMHAQTHRRKKDCYICTGLMFENRTCYFCPCLFTVSLHAHMNWHVTLQACQWLQLWQLMLTEDFTVKHIPTFPAYQHSHPIRASNTHFGPNTVMLLPLHQEYIIKRERECVCPTLLWCLQQLLYEF